MAGAPHTVPTRELIVSSAARFLRENVGRRITMTDIARTSGLSRGTIYAHFSDRDEVLAAVAEAASGKFYGALADVMALEPRLEDKMSAIAMVVVDTMRSESDVTLAADEVSLLLTLHAGRLLADCVAFLTPYLEEAKVEGEVRRDLEVTAAAEWFARILFSLASTPSSTLDLEDREVVRRFVGDHVVRGFGPPVAG